MKDNCLYIGLDELVDLLIKIYSSTDLSPIFDELPEPNPEDLSGLDNLIYIGNSGVIDKDIHDPEDKDLGNISLINLDENLSDSDLYNEFEKAYSTSLNTPPAALLAAAIQAPEDSELIETFHPDP